MNTETQKTFLRKAAPKVEFTPMSIKEGEKAFIQIKSPKITSMFLKNKGEDVPCVAVINLETNENKVLWLSGKLLQSFKVLQLAGPLTDKRLEIANQGTESTEVGDLTYDMNKYEVHELQ